MGRYGLRADRLLSKSAGRVTEKKNRKNPGRKQTDRPARAKRTPKRPAADLRPTLAIEHGPAEASASDAPILESETGADQPAAPIAPAARGTRARRATKPSIPEAPPITLANEPAPAERPLAPSPRR